MKAVKENKVYTLTNEQEAELYRLKGFDILDDNGNILKYGAGKTVPYEKYAAVAAELEQLKAAKKTSK